MTSTKSLNLAQHGYEIIDRLGQNIEAGRATYKAIELYSEQPVVIKQFRFLNSGDWSDFKAIEREIETLQKLSHPKIPRYLNSFDSGEGMCLVQEYIDAQPLSIWGKCTLEQVSSIAFALLEILEYLQSQNPPLIHRDIKPENILMKQNGDIYLVDFGLARKSDRPMALSTMMAGTPGFMPPEVFHNLPLSLNSDLYSLGVTLICLLTGTKSFEISNLINQATFRLEFQHLVPQVDRSFVRWLEKMIEVDARMRFSRASIASSQLSRLSELVVEEEDLEIEETEELELFQLLVGGVLVVATIGGIGWGVFNFFLSTRVLQPVVVQPSPTPQEFVGIEKFFEQNFPEIAPAMSLGLGIARILMVMVAMGSFLNAFIAYRNYEEAAPHVAMGLVIVMALVGTQVFFGILIH